MSLARRIERTVEIAGLVGDRLRARLLALRGADIGDRVRVGRRVRVDRPWSVRLGERAVIERDVWFKIVADDARLELGAHVFVGCGTEFDVLSQVRVGAHALIAPGVFITDHWHRFSRAARVDQQGCEAAAVSIGGDAWIGAHAVVLAGVTVGEGAVVGAGALVREDVPPFKIVAGVPARVIGERT